MELLSIILLIIIGLLTFLLLKKERVLGINTDENKNNDQIKIIESKNYRKNIYNLLNYIPEGILILDKSKKIIYTNNSASEWFQTKLDENISSFLRNPDLLIAIDKAFEGNNLTDLEIEIRNQSTFRLNITIYLDKTNLFIYIIFFGYFVFVK